MNTKGRPGGRLWHCCLARFPAASFSFSTRLHDPSRLPVAMNNVNGFLPAELS
jgi:hypothetical protein